MKNHSCANVLTCLIAALAFAATAKAGTVYDTSLASPGYYNGTGNANTNFAVDTEGNLELGLSVIQRYVGPIDPGAGSNVYTVSTSAGPLATWNFEFSVNTQAGGGSNVLSDYTYSMSIEDVTADTTGPTFDPVAAIPDDSGYGSTGKTPGVTTATEWGAQNSENLGFPGFLPGFNATNPDEYEIILAAYNQSVSQVASVTVFADAATVPEPATFFLFGPAVLGLAFAARRKR
jgi:hypothetical protein